mgnify:CR=1 FL=1
MDKYTALAQDIIDKQKVVLGPDIAVLKARSVSGIKVNDAGEVTAITGDPMQAVSHLVDAYVDLSGQIVKSTLLSVFAKHEINHEEL